MSRHEPVFLGRHKANTPAWHALRATGIGASEVAAVLGLSPWLSPFTLWHLKAGNVADGFVENPATYWGTTLEPVIAREYRARHRRRVMLQPGTYHHPDRRWQLVNPDGLIGTARQGFELLEVKTARTADGFGDDGTDEVPVHYACQVMHALDVMGLERATLAVLIGGSDYREYHLTFDEAEAAILRDAAATFWQSIADGIMPAVDAADSTTRTLRALHPDIVDVEVAVPRSIADEYAIATGAYRVAEARRKAATNALLEVMGDGRYAVTEGRKVATRSVSTPRRLDTTRLRDELPDVADAFTKPGKPEHKLIPAKNLEELTA